MSGFEIISDVSKMLINSLRDNISPDLSGAPANVELCSPAEVAGTNIRLSLFLYEIAKETDLHTYIADVSSDKQAGLPLPLKLYYLLTAYSSGNVGSRSYDEQLLLGRAMQVFNDYPGISSSAPSGVQAQLILNPLTVDDMNKIWTMFPGTPYKLSVGYIVTPVIIRSALSKTFSRVLQGEIDYFQIKR